MRRSRQNRAVLPFSAVLLKRHRKIIKKRKIGQNRAVLYDFEFSPASVCGVRRILPGFICDNRSFSAKRANGAAKPNRRNRVFSRFPAGRTAADNPERRFIIRTTAGKAKTVRHFRTIKSNGQVPRRYTENGAKPRRNGLIKPGFTLFWQKAYQSTISS